MGKEKKSAEQQLQHEAERQALHPTASRQAIAESQAEPEFRQNHQRLKADRLAREAAESEAAAAPMLKPTPELPDDTPIDRVRFSRKISSVLNAAGLKTVGEVRETSDDNMRSLPNLGPSSLASLREMLGLASCDGVRRKKTT